MTSKLGRVRSNASGLEPLAMSMVLPHERKAMRLPVVPAALTALLETMADRTITVPDGQGRLASLCRDTCYPLWMQRDVINACSYLQSAGSATSWTIPAEKNKQILLPMWDSQGAFANSGITPPTPTVDGDTTSVNRIVDYTPLARVDGYLAIYVPIGGSLCIRVITGAAGGGTGLEAELGYVTKGQINYSTVLIPQTTDGFLFLGTPGAPLAANAGEGTVPFGFVFLKSLRTGDSAVTAAATPLLQFGWSTGAAFNALTNVPAKVMLPVFNPPEFGNSTLPYAKSRQNASAALFTNVGAALNKEGTVLASRLDGNRVDFHTFTTSDIDSVHPKLRYYGPLEKGLYTFTTPSGNVDDLNDCRLALASGSSQNPLQRPLFDPVNVGIFNAMIFTDLGSGVLGATQLATSLYTHIEFESTSSLFTIGVSTMSLETLHAAEVALLRFGHFHENPTHWAVIANAASAILRSVAPMIAPVVAHYGQMALDKGVQYLRGKESGDRRMTQALAPRVAAPPRRPKPPARRRAKAAQKKRQ